MKRRIAILVTGLCVLSLFAGCGKSQNTSNNENQVVTAEDGTADDSVQESTFEPSYAAADYVTLGEYKGLELTVEKAEVTEDDVKTYVANMVAYYPSYKDTDKTVVEKGDFVNIDYEGLKDGVAFDGGTASGYVLEIGSNSFIDGFEDGLIGAKVGEKVALDLTFPENYQSADLAGQAVVFNVTVNKIVEKEEVTYDNITDEYVETNFSSYYGYKTVEELKTGVKENLESTNEYYAQNNARTALITKLQEVCTVNGLPEGVLEDRISKYKEQFERMCTEQYNMTSEEYLTQQGLNAEEFDAEIETYMQENLELEMILVCISENEGIVSDEEGYKTYLNNMMSSYGYEKEDDVYAEYGEEYIRNSYVGNLAMEQILADAKITYTKPAETTEETAETTEETAETTEDSTAETTE